MPNFFIFVLQPRVVPPNQYMIHKYPRAPCSRQRAMTRAWESASFTPPGRETKVFLWSLWCRVKCRKSEAWLYTCIRAPGKQKARFCQCFKVMFRQFEGCTCLMSGKHMLRIVWPSGKYIFTFTRVRQEDQYQTLLWTLTVNMKLA